jgi:hypothetical protein
MHHSAGTICTRADSNDCGSRLACKPFLNAFSAVRTNPATAGDEQSTQATAANERRQRAQQSLDGAGRMRSDFAMSGTSGNDQCFIDEGFGRMFCKWQTSGV